MKKIFLFLLGLFFVSVQTFADTRATALLLHNGQGKSFDADQLQQAVNEAVSGDTICLSEGTFNLNGTMTINKDVSLIGAGGEKTILRGSLNYAIDGTPKISRHLLDALQITNSLEISKEQQGLRIRKCWIGNHLYALADLKELEIDRCFIDTLAPSAHIKSASVVNSVITYIGYNASGKPNPYPYNSTGNDWAFVNCSILYLFSYGVNTPNTFTDASFTNCILYSIETPSYNGSERNTYTNCLSSTGYGNSSVTHNCYKQAMNPGTNTAKNNYPSFIISGKDIGIGNVSALDSRGYYGTDGTVVGAFGNATPYTLETEDITVKESILRVDPETRKLNVTLKVATE